MTSEQQPRQENLSSPERHGADRAAVLHAFHRALSLMEADPGVSSDDIRLTSIHAALAQTLDIGQETFVQRFEDRGGPGEDRPTGRFFEHEEGVPVHDLLEWMMQDVEKLPEGSPARREREYLLGMLHCHSSAPGAILNNMDVRTRHERVRLEAYLVWTKNQSLRPEEAWKIAEKRLAARRELVLPGEQRAEAADVVPAEPEKPPSEEVESAPLLLAQPTAEPNGEEVTSEGEEVEEQPAGESPARILTVAPSGEIVVDERGKENSEAEEEEVVEHPTAGAEVSPPENGEDVGDDTPQAGDERVERAAPAVEQTTPATQERLQKSRLRQFSEWFVWRLQTPPFEQKVGQFGDWLERRLGSIRRFFERWFPITPDQKMKERMEKWDRAILNFFFPSRRAPDQPATQEAAEGRRIGEEAQEERSPEEVSTRDRLIRAARDRLSQLLTAVRPSHAQS